MTEETLVVSAKAGVILPSRGLIFSQTADEILQNLKGIPHKFFFSHRKPLPQCFEEPVNEALKDPSITHLWLIEDDMKLPPDTLKKMLEADANVITCDYPITKQGRGSVFYDPAGNVVFCGTGCLLVAKEVFLNLKTPYFTDQIRWNLLNYGDTIKLVGSKNNKGEGYGLHDITFCLKLWKQGIKIKALSVKLGQRKLVEWGKAGSNDGAHKIEVWRKINKDVRLKEVSRQPLATGARTKLVAVKTPSGEVSTSIGHAQTMVDKGLAQYPPKSHAIIDDSEVEL
jgi:hypothetical protein